jgi:hypothetical protein
MLVGQRTLQRGRQEATAPVTSTSVADTFFSEWTGLFCGSVEWHGVCMMLECEISLHFARSKTFHRNMYESVRN